MQYAPTFGILNAMDWNKTLFDNNQFSNIRKEAAPLERLKNLEEKIASAIDKVRALKEEKADMGRRIKELEEKLNEKNQEVERLQSEKISIKSQVEDLLNELETLELG